MYNYRRKELNTRLAGQPFLRVKYSESSLERDCGNLRIVAAGDKPKYLGARESDWRVNDEGCEKHFENHRNDSSWRVCFCGCPAAGVKGGGNHIGHHNWTGSTVD